MTDQHKDGGPAFPTGLTAGHYSQEGMTLRDWFAGQALASIAHENPNLPDDNASRHDWPSPAELAMRRAVWSYLQADAMIAARGAK